MRARGRGLALGDDASGTGNWALWQYRLRELWQSAEVQTRLGRLTLQTALAVAVFILILLVRWLPVSELIPLKQAVARSFRQDYTVTMAWRQAVSWAKPRGGWLRAAGLVYETGREQVVGWIAPAWIAKGARVPAAAEPPAESAVLPAPPTPLPPPPSAANAPVEWMAGPVISAWGWRPAPGGGQQLHEGLDIAVGAGSVITPFRGGIVSSVGTDPEIGSFILIRHADDTAARYAPFAQVNVRPGDQIQAHTVLGLLGWAPPGEPGAAHLHLEVRVGDVPVDPAPFLKGEGVL